VSCRALLVCACIALGCGKSGSREAPAPPSSDDAGAAAAIAIDAAVRPARRARPAKSKAYAVALQRGRKLAAAGDYPAAIAALQRALAAVPDDARALSELGWVAFKHGDLALADDATERSIAAAREPRLRAASLYNRGRIAEARGDRDRAADAYRASLELRPNETVAARLEGLGGEVAQALAPRPLDGPYPTIAAACAALPFYEKGWSCAAPAIDGPNQLAEPGPPYLAVRIVGENPGAYSGGESWDNCRIAIRVAAGWYLGEPITCEQYAWAKSRVISLDRAGGGDDRAPVVVWKHEHRAGDRGVDRDGARYQTWVTYRWAIYCGVGPSKVPSCTPRLPLSISEQGDHAYSEVVPHQLDAELAAGGVLRVTARSKVAADLRPLLGERRLAFP
jgi:hypothetical protein